MLPHFLPYPGVHACKEHIHLVCSYFTSMHRDLFITRVEILQPYLVTIFSQICLFVTSEQPAQNALGLLVRLHQCDRYLTPFKVAAYNLSLKRVKNRVSNGYLSKIVAWKRHIWHKDFIDESAHIYKMFELSSNSFLLSF